MKNLLLDVAEAVSLIKSNKVALFAGSEDGLAQLPRGRWIGGTTSYLVGEKGGAVNPTKLFCTLVEEANEVNAAMLKADALPRVTEGRCKNGFTYVLLPAFSSVHQKYALEAPGYPGLYDQPLMGWVSGIHLNDIGKRSPKVYDGQTGTSQDNAAAVLHVGFPSGFNADLDIVNLFTQGSGEEIRFPKTAFSAKECTVAGRPTTLSRYIQDKNIDTKLPLVADYSGAMVNVSVQSVDASKEEVQFYAPVVEGQAYRFARSIGEYGSAYGQLVNKNKDGKDSLSCNCILNFVYAQLEGKRTGEFVGPVTFGEIAYILLNQTLVRLQVTH